MRILGLDPGTRRTGYGIVDSQPGTDSYVECGVLATTPTEPLALRLREVYSGLKEIIQELRPEAVAVEEVFHGINTRSALILGHIRGVALLAAAEAGLCVFSYAPTRIKRSVGGMGRAD